MSYSSSSDTYSPYFGAGTFSVNGATVYSSGNGKVKAVFKTENSSAVLDYVTDIRFGSTSSSATNLSVGSSVAISSLGSYIKVSVAAGKNIKAYLKNSTSSSVTSTSNAIAAFISASGTVLKTVAINNKNGTSSTSYSLDTDISTAQDVYLAFFRNGDSGGGLKVLKFEISNASSSSSGGSSSGTVTPVVNYVYLTGSTSTAALSYNTTYEYYTDASHYKYVNSYTVNGVSISMTGIRNGDKFTSTSSSTYNGTTTTSTKDYIAFVGGQTTVPYGTSYTTAADGTKIYTWNENNVTSTVKVVDGAITELITNTNGQTYNKSTYEYVTDSRLGKALSLIMVYESTDGSTWTARDKTRLEITYTNETTVTLKNYFTQYTNGVAGTETETSTSIYQRHAYPFSN